MGTDKTTAGLEALGLSEGEAKVYACLVSGSGATAKEVARATGVPARLAKAHLESLDDNGLATRSILDGERFVPVPPQHAVDSLRQRREQQLSEASRDAIRYLEQASGPPGRQPDRGFLQVVAGAEAAGDRFQQMVLGAKSEILAFNAKAMSGVNDEWVKAKIALLKTGVRGRVIYDLPSLQNPDAAALIRKFAFGEAARTLPVLPLPLVIIDRGAAFLPLTSEEPGPATEVFIVYESALLDLLLLMFEAVWETAAPFDAETGVAGTDPAGLDLAEDERMLLNLLSAGMKEAAIAQHLGVSARTVERRFSAITDLLGTTTRFHTAVEAYRRGWITSSGSGSGR